MGNKEAKKSTRMTDTAFNTSNQGYGNFLNSANAGLQNAMTGAAGLRDQITGLYGNAATGGLGIGRNENGFFNLPGGFGGGGGGGGSVNFGGIGDYGSARKTFQDLANTGGDFGESMAAFKNLAGGGGINQDAMRYRATSQIPSFYENLKNDMSRRRKVQGGYSPGFDASMAEMSRQAGRESYNASRMAEADISDRLQQGLAMGAQGMAGIQGQQAGNRLAGGQGLFGIGRAEQDAMTTNAQLGEARAGRDMDAQLRLLGMDQDRRLAGMGGLLDTYRSAPGDVGMYLDSVLGGLGGRNQGASALLGHRIQNNPNISGWDRAMQGIGAGAGLIGSIYGTGGIVGPRR